MPGVGNGGPPVQGFGATGLAGYTRRGNLIILNSVGGCP